MQINLVVSNLFVSLHHQNTHTMKLITFLLTLFFIAIIFVMFAICTIDIDMFMWAAGIGDLIGFIIIFMQWQFNDKLYQKIW
jgi:hypothetical protein